MTEPGARNADALAALPPAPRAEDLPPSRRGPAARLALCALGLAGAFVVAWGITLPDLQLCAFKAVTGRPCPGCGMTRSIVSLFRGDVLASLRFHPLGIVLAGTLVAGAAGAAAGVAGRRDRAWEWFDRRGGTAAIVFGAALLALWALRAFVVPEWSPDPVGPPALPWSAK